jgi:MYXO-CTERM domain-containing protein
MKHQALALTLASLLATLNAQAFTLMNAFNTADGARVGGAEILAYTTDMNTLLSTVGDNAGGSFGVQVLTLGSNASLTERGFVDMSSIFGAAGNWNGASSVSVDPLGRGWGAVSLIPSASTTTAGKVAFFDYRNPAALVTLDVGFHPDSVKFSADGTKLFVVNEGEFSASSGVNAPGSISIIDLAGINTLADVNSTNITSGNVSTYDFSSANLAAGVTLEGIRNHSVAAVGTSGTFIGTVPNFVALAGSDPDFYKGMEPEFVVQNGNKLYVSLQENNAIGTFDLTTNKWEKISSLGTIQQTIDASDQDGGANINDLVRGLPMPDTIAHYSVAGTSYIVSVNEGDARPDDRDISRFGDIAGGDSMNNILDTTLFPTTQTGVRDNSVLGRLNVSRLDGDTNADGKIDTPTMIGTRSFSIWNADTGALVWDSGSLESVLLGLEPAMHNNNQNSFGTAPNTDSRSDDKGPEPEALTVGQFGSDMLAFVGLERQGGTLVYNINDPNNPSYVGYISAGENYANGLVGPESMVFISAADSPTGTAMLVTGYEITNGIGVYSVPEPSRAMLGLLGVAFIAMRRRRVR